MKANLDRARPRPYSTHLNALKSVTNVTAVNPTTVRLALAPGQGVQLPSVLALNAGMIVNPKAIADPNADLTQGPGAGNESGPYKLESTTLATGVRARRSSRSATTGPSTGTRPRAASSG